MTCFAVIVTAEIKLIRSKKKEATTYLLCKFNVPEIINTK